MLQKGVKKSKWHFYSKDTFWYPFSRPNISVWRRRAVNAHEMAMRACARITCARTKGHFLGQNGPQNDDNFRFCCCKAMPAHARMRAISCARHGSDEDDKDMKSILKLSNFSKMIFSRFLPHPNSPPNSKLRFRSAFRPKMTFFDFCKNKYRGCGEIGKRKRSIFE